MSEHASVCLQESEEVPRDFMSLFNLSMYKMDTSILSDVIKYDTVMYVYCTYSSFKINLNMIYVWFNYILYCCRAFDALGLKYEPLTLFTPQFETQLPPL